MLSNHFVMLVFGLVLSSSNQPGGLRCATPADKSLIKGFYHRSQIDYDRLNTRLCTLLWLFDEFFIPHAIRRR